MKGAKDGMSTAIFGGTFDPVHNGHLAAASAAADNFHIQKIFFIPAGHPPHKCELPKTPYMHRLRMIELACMADPRFVPSRLEEPQTASGLHYSINTIERLRQDLKSNDPLFFIIGSDAFAEFPMWHRHHEVAREVEFVVVNRPGWDYAPQQPNDSGVRAHYLKDVVMPISSTKLRQLLQSRENVSKIHRNSGK